MELEFICPQNGTAVLFNNRVDTMVDAMVDATVDAMVDAMVDAVLISQSEMFSSRSALNPFRTAVPFWGKIASN